MTRELFKLLSVKGRFMNGEGINTVSSPTPPVPPPFEKSPASTSETYLSNFKFNMISHWPVKSVELWKRVL